MHECQNCYMACDCDGEDIWWEFTSEAAEQCSHECEEHEEDDFDE